MKKFLVLLIAIIGMQFAYAGDTANIKIKIKGSLRNNTYFLCLPNIGCLSILAAEKGKIYPIFHDFEMNNLFVTDVESDFRVTPQGLPASCNVTVKTNQTITIMGNISAHTNGSVHVNNLRCSVS